LELSTESVPPVADATDVLLSGPHALDVYVQYALANNMAILAAIHDVNAARDRVPQARSLEAPMLMARGYPFFPNTPQTASGRATGGVGVSQKFPWFGKLRLQGEIACDELRIAEAQLAATRLEVTEQVRRTYYELYYLQRGIHITQENRKVLEQIARVAEAKYQVNQISQQDLLRAQVELSILDTELVRLRQELVSNQARLARLLHVSQNANLQAEEIIDEADMALELDRLYDLAVQARPELQAGLHAISRAQNATALARKQYLPDATFGIDWMEMTTQKALAPTADGMDDVGLSLTVNLPIYYNRLDAAVREAESRTCAAARRYDAQRDQTLETVKDLFTQIQSQRELIQLFAQSILPKAQQTLEVSLTGYQAGQVDFLQLLSNFQEILKVQLMLERQRSQLQQTLASLDRAIGGGLNGHSSQL
jgi:outer membrane protein TolC